MESYPLCTDPKKNEKPWHRKSTVWGMDKKINFYSKTSLIRNSRYWWTACFFAHFAYAARSAPRGDRRTADAQAPLAMINELLSEYRTHLPWKRGKASSGKLGDDGGLRIVLGPQHTERRLRTASLWHCSNVRCTDAWRTNYRYTAQDKLKKEFTELPEA
jgi:hypothetical protein